MASMKKTILFSLWFAVNLYATNYDALLFQGNCTTCHFNNKALSAPSMQEIKKHYISAFPQKKAFVAYMSEWVKTPDEKTTLIHEAVEKYGLMPELAYDLEALKSIAGYIYETDFSKEEKNR